MPNTQTVSVPQSYINAFGKTIVTATMTATGDFSGNLNEVLPAATTSQQYTLTIVRTKLQALCLAVSLAAAALTDTTVTVKTNNAGGVDTLSFVIPAGSVTCPPIILLGTAARALFTADVTSVFITNPSTVSANVVLDYLYNA